MESEEIRTTIQIADMNLQENDHKIIKVNDTHESFIQEQVKLEPIDIKIESFESNNEEIEADDGVIQSYDNQQNEFSRVDKQALLERIPKMVVTIPNKCDICDIIFQSKRNFSDHFESHKNVLPYKCSQCSTDANPLIVSTTIALSKHFETHSFKYTCSHCPLRFRTLSLLKFHLRDTHEEQKQACQYKTRGRVQKQKDQEPMNVKIEPLNDDYDEIKNGDKISQPKSQRFNCDSCEKHFSTLQLLQRHQVSHRRQHSASTRNTRRKMTTVETRNCQSMEIGEKSSDGGEGMITVTNSQENDGIHNESINHSSDVNDFEEQKIDNSFNQNETVTFIQEQIELEPIDLKEEQFESEDEETEEDETAQRYEKENVKVRRPKKRRKLPCPPEVVQPIPNKCFICDITLESESKLKTHLLSHLEMLPYKCSRCSTETNPIVLVTANLLNKHFEKHGFNYVCPQCPLRFRTSDQIRYHVLSVHKQDRFEFDGKVFNNIYAYQRYVRNYKNVTTQRFKCEFCGKYCKTRHHLQLHLKVHEKPQIVGETVEPIEDSLTDPNKVHKCFICDTILGSKSELKTHLQSHLEMIPYECSRCSTETNPIILVTANLLNKHFEMHGFNYACRQCPLRFRVREGIRYHMKSVHNEKRFEFDGKIFTNIYSYKRYVRIHNNVTMQRFKCEFCEKYCKTRNHLRLHLKVHKKPPIVDETVNKVETIPNKCFICDTILESRSELETHLQSHNEMIPYECPRCSTETNPIVLVTVNLLNKHFEMHGFNYACRQCPLRFRTNERIRYHMHSVHNEKRFEFNGKTFTNVYAYKRYVRLYNNVTTKRFRCEFCGKYCKTRNLLQLHLEVHKKPRIVRKAVKRPKVIRNGPTRWTDPNKVETIPNKCYICDTVCDSEEDFDKHLESHKTMLPFQCSQCSTEANTIIVGALSTLNKHFERHGFYYACPHCPLRYRTVNAMIVHKCKAHENQQVEPEQKLREKATDESTEEPSCSKRRKKKWIDPKRVDRIPNKCYICDTNHESSDDFVEHLKSHKNMLPFQCSRCSTEANPIKVGSLTKLNDHFERHSFHYVCPYCPLRFRSSHTVTQHKRINHNNGLGVEPGNASASKAEETLRETATDKPTDTPSRPKKTRNRFDRKKVETIPNKCYICDTIYDSVGDFDKHLESHKTMLPFRCSRCSTEANPIIVDVLTGLNKHFERHSFNYVCPHCPLLYRTANSLKHHKLSHKEQQVGTDSASTNVPEKKLRETTRKRKIDTKDDPGCVKKKRGPWIDVKRAERIPNKCFVCETILESEDHLDKHLDSHENMLPFKCPQCSTDAYPINVHTVSGLNKHFEKHGFFYVCSYCPLRYRTSNALLHHKRTTHKKQRAAGEQRSGETESADRGTRQIIMYANEDDESNNQNAKADGSIQEQTKSKESIGIKEERFESNDVEMDDDETTQSFENENNKPILRRRRRKESEPPKVTILNKCYVCDTILGSEIEFNNHLESHKEMLPYECEQCSTKENPVICSTVSLLNGHFEMHGFNYTCKDCPAKSSFLKHMTSRMKEQLGPTGNTSETESDTLKLSSKQKDYDKLDNTNSTGKSEPNDADGTLSHDEATEDESNNGASHDRKEQTISHPKRKKIFKNDPNTVETIPNKCYICDTVLESKGEFDDHLEMLHKNLLPYQCSQCSTEKYPIKCHTATALNKHFERHNFNYICPHCPLRFRTRKAMLSHIRFTHEGQTFQFSCEYCGKVLNNRRSYCKHVNVHKNLILQRYKCEPCQRLFTSNHYLLAHKKAIYCKGNTEKRARRRSNTKKSRKSTRSKEGSISEATIEAEEQTGMSNTPENNCSISVKKEIDDRDIARCDEKHHKIADFIQEQIKQEPIDIKDELLDDELNDE